VVKLNGEDDTGYRLGEEVSIAASSKSENAVILSRSLLTMISF
jgi:hypothetical protein